MIDLRHQDCMEYMRGLPDKAFDLAIVDPPYGIDIMHAGGYSEKQNFYTYERKDWDANAPTSEYFAELRRVSVSQVVWGGNYFANHLPHSQCWLIWDKMQRNFTKADFEMAWTSFDSASRAFNMSRATAYCNQVKIHPTQKPVALYRWLLKNYAKPGQRILDTHLGSGSIAIACDIEGFDLVGTEIDADYIAGARKRLADHQSQPRLFDAPPTEQPVQLQMVQ
jgi:site-specific DNA-methyltransferase (adenine-specific)